MHRFHRPAVLIAKSMAGGDERAMLDWLQPPPVTGHTSADLDLFRAAGVQPPPKRTT
jgi:hypothetical protein